MGRVQRMAVFVLAFAAVAVAAWPAAAQSCERQLRAEVVALDQPYFWNRLGAAQPQGQIYALRRDVVAKTAGTKPGPGNAKLREGKRPRPLVLRMNVGDCLSITFHNWLDNVFDIDSSWGAIDATRGSDDQPRTTDVSIHVAGMQLLDISDDGSWVGLNQSSLVPIGGTHVYDLYAEREGTYLLHSGAPLTGGPQSDNGTLSTGLFGAVNVEPRGSEWYRSQVTEKDLALAFTNDPWQTSSSLLGSTSAEAVGVHAYPTIDYSRRYPSTHLRSGTPILQILDPLSLEIVHSDLTAIIVPDAGTYRRVAVYPNRDEPFREFTIIFHDELGAVQAFPHFYDGDEHDPSTHSEGGGLAFTLHSVRDAFAINYGTGGIGSEILANRLGVGPMHECVNCRYEEFFLSAWAVGDPAMVVDVPANAPCTKRQIESGVTEKETSNFCVQPGAKATKAFYPDDPSNVYHSYLNDHVKFRNLLAGSDDHHIFHLHAHQWLHTPDSDNSTYLDSQAIGQGSSFTYEIAHEGSGNRNKTPGDSIFHCHFYPHFAQGMWSMWRVHDVLELGTRMDGDGTPASGARALPDGEIAQGTPIPGLVPLPGQPMPPPPAVPVTIANGQVVMPATGTGNPGYPFWVPGRAGQRAPTPPLDVFVENGVAHDGGLPRLIIDGGKIQELHTRLDFSKDLLVADAFELDEHGEHWERQAMQFHADGFDGSRDGFIATRRPDGTWGKFEVNGSEPRPGAPYAEPCYRPSQTGYPNARRDIQYRAANIQMDVVFNKKGWHFPQQRFLSLWEDVDDFKAGRKPPEPLFIRANSYDCVEYLHTNLVPIYYELDDFQVRTPTDILGQHIHLVKFDVTSSDGSANGFNYEDGTLSPGEVVHLIDVINLAGGIRESIDDPTRRLLQVKNHPFFNVPGAQTTVQRWYVDNVLNTYAVDRTLRTVFTHDHFGPSTHQQVGLYAGLVTQREGSLWYHGETGAPLGFDLSGSAFRKDGGPTSWQAVIEGPEIFREFLLEFGDFQHAYDGLENGYPDPAHAINPPGRVKKWDQLATHPWVYEKPFFAGVCPSGGAPPCPEAVSADDPGTMLVNYRQEPLALRVKQPGANQQAANQQGDLSWAFASIPRADNDLNVVEPNYATTLTTASALGPYDPYTPMLRAYEDDHVRIRVLVGAHEEEHNFSLHGTRWLFEPEEPNSGLKASQMMGISEFYDFVLPPLISDVPAHALSDLNREGVDFLYKAGSAADDLWNGIWGLMRVYRGPRADLRLLSTNTDAAAPEVVKVAQQDYNGPCPKTTYQQGKVRYYDVVAVAANQVLPEGRLLWNDRTTLAGAPLNDPTAIMFVHRGDMSSGSGKHWPLGSACDLSLPKNKAREPLILRAAAGECVEVRLTNCLPAQPADVLGYSLLPNIVDKFNQNQVAPSGHVGLHAQMVTVDMAKSDAVNVGRNPVQTVAPGGNARTYQWYAGVNVVKNGAITSIPHEFGSVALYSSDPIKHSNKGAVGALIVEPENATWATNSYSRAKAIVNRPATSTQAGETFREFVLVFHDDVNLLYGSGKPVRPLEVNEDPAETGQVGVNYRTEPVWFREQYPPEQMVNIDFAETFANSKVGGDPKTPVFHALAGEPIRMRVIHPAGDPQQHAFGLHGHVWQETPYVQGSKVIGDNPLSEWKGVQYGHGPTNAFDVLPRNGAGGAFGVTGDFMYRDYVSWYLANGIWGLLRVHGTHSELHDADPGWNAYPLGEPINCTQVITYAQDPATGECHQFATPCDVPDGWGACSGAQWPTVSEASLFQPSSDGQ
jgi:manganese oxidase